MGAYFRPLLSYWLEILLGAFILLAADDIRWFLFYLFLVLILMVSRTSDHLRKLMRVFQIGNEIKMLAVIRKLKITDDEISIVADDAQAKMGEAKWKEIEKELSDLI